MIELAEGRTKAPFSNQEIIAKGCIDTLLIHDTDFLMCGICCVCDILRNILINTKEVAQYII